MKRFMITLVIAIPLCSVVVGGVMFYFAVTGYPGEVLDTAKPLSKTSWQKEK